MSQMFLNVVSTFKGDGLSAATRQLGAFGSAAGGLGSTLGKVGAALASFGLAAKSVEFAKSSIDSARDLERNLFSVNTIFGDLAPRMIRFSKEAENIGLSQKDAAKAVTFLGSVLKQSGFEMEDVVTESEKLVSLGVDLAATYGYDVQEALLGMTALFRGEYDPIEKFGVAMKQAEINAELQARGLHKLTGAALRNAEQTIRMELLYERAADASGAFTAQTGNLFVEQKKLSAQFENMQATVGTALLPAMGELVQTLVPLVDDLMPRLVQVVKDAAPALEAMVGFLKDASDESTETGATISFLADVLGGAFRIISENFTTLVQLAALFLGARIAIFGVTTALTLLQAHPVIATITLLTAGIILLTNAAKNLQFDVDKSGASVTSFNMAISDSAKNGKYVTDRYGEFKVAITEASDEAVRLGKEVANADKAKLDNLKNAILGVKISAAEAANEVARMYRQAGMKPPGSTGTVIDTGTSTTTTTGGGQAAASAVVDVYKEFRQANVFEGKKAQKQTILLGKNLSRGLVDQILTSNKPLKLANDIIAKTTKKGGETRNKVVNNLNKEFAATYSEVNRVASEAASAAAAQAQEAQRQADELRRAEEARIEGLNQLYANFLDTIKGTFAGIRNAIQGAFDITGLGGSTNAIIRNMNKLLAKMKSFSANVKSLATMGLDPALLQQVIQAGPVAGSRLAAALVAGGAGALGDINAGFMQASSLASEIATTGVQSLFDTQKQQNVYNITVTGGVGSGSTIGKAIVDAIKDYERTSGAVWQGA
jgi:hypothetical protein